MVADNAQVFQFAYDSISEKYGYKVKEADTDVFVPFSSGLESGTFITANTQYGTVSVNCGFRPRFIKVILPFSNGNTISVYDETLFSDKSVWLIPQEGNKVIYATLGSTQGETGIVNITDNGFVFRSYAVNTQNVECTFIAVQ